MGLNLVVLWCGLKPIFECVVSGASWEGLPCSPFSAMPVIGLGLPATKLYAVGCCLRWTLGSMWR